MMIEETPGTYVGQQLERGSTPREIFERADRTWRSLLRMAKSSSLEWAFDDHADFFAEVRNILIRTGMAR